MAEETDSSVRCPVCGKTLFECANDFDVCEVCGWENDGIQYDRPDYMGGANRMSLNQARHLWKRYHENVNLHEQEVLNPRP